jgi:hypothetical protein
LYSASGVRTCWIRLAPAGRREARRDGSPLTAARRAVLAPSCPTFDRAASSRLPVRVYTTIRVSDAYSLSLMENLGLRRLMNSCKAARLIRESEFENQSVFRAHATQNRIGVKPCCALSRWPPDLMRRRQPARPTASSLATALCAGASPNNAPAICGRRPRSPFSCASSGPHRGGRTAPAPRDSAGA